MLAQGLTWLAQGWLGMGADLGLMGNAGGWHRAWLRLAQGWLGAGARLDLAGMGWFRLELRFGGLRVARGPTLAVSGSWHLAVATHFHPAGCERALLLPLRMWLFSF